jgi:predicted HTH transcriptional regulator
LTTKIAKEDYFRELDLDQLVLNGESDTVEFKMTLRTNLHTGNKDPRMELAVLKTLAGFLNTNGGTLIIGISDENEPVGIEVNGFSNEDKMNLHLVNLVKNQISPQAMTLIHTHFEDYKEKRIMVIECNKSPVAVFIKDGVSERFYLRTGPSTTELSASQTQDYIKLKFSL